MAEIKIPLYFSVGDGEKIRVGDITAKPGSDCGTVSMPGFLRKCADEVERQLTEMPEPWRGELECPSCNTDDPADLTHGPVPCEDPWHVEAAMAPEFQADHA